MPQIGPVPKPGDYEDYGEPSTPEDTTESDSQQGTIDMDYAERLPFVGGAYKAFNYMQEARERAALSNKIGDIEFTEEGIDKIIERVNEIATQLDNAKARSRDLYNVDPGHEYVSSQYKNTADQMADDYNDFHNKSTDSYEDFRKMLEEVKRNYLSHEDGIVTDLGKEYS
ncbi:hypothetical protein H0B56_18835 [Haloechinothrix sp. YIM 98757]|uniref:Uncharacterized protein n=1 Tax=Haloechinothrix aidingensis TaxID=2752311 RepID=A0A838AE61_9PSEU|nr:hypothetical protein [Haloechinothrix aidingensis]MBA0127604.1 hypothetical protein [Haloechinothrix aidingensis]